MKVGSRLTIRAYPVRQLDYGTENKVIVLMSTLVVGISFFRSLRKEVTKGY